jgi:prostaglandin-H2 D-isomerase / glutathione transferase
LQKSNIKLIYFDFSFWRVDVCRLTLSIGKIPYEYIRIPRRDWLIKKKSGDFIFGQLPVMTINGKMFAQTAAMTRYCGKLANLIPNDDIDALLVDQILDVANDITYIIGPSIREKNLDKKKHMRLELNEKKLPIWLSHLENFLIDNKKSDFLISKNLTIADIVMWRVLLWLSCGLLENISKNIIKEFKLLNGYFSFISSNETIRKTDEYKEITKEVSKRTVIM